MRGKFDTAIVYLRNGFRWGVSKTLRHQCKAAIAVLEQVEVKDALIEFLTSGIEKFSKYRPLIEAASKVDKELTLALINAIGWPRGHDNMIISRDQIRALLNALPEVEEESKHYRCEGCGWTFDKKLFSHSRLADDGKGNAVEVECGPISEVKP